MGRGITAYHATQGSDIGRSKSKGGDLRCANSFLKASVSVGYRLQVALAVAAQSDDGWRRYRHRRRSKHRQIVMLISAQDEEPARWHQQNAFGDPRKRLRER